MTKQEALEILDTIPTIGDQVDALEIAIEALETSINYDEQVNKDKLVLHNDKLIIEPIVYLKSQTYRQLLKEVQKQLDSNSRVIILPPGLMAKIVRQESVFINGKWEKGEADDN